MRTIRRLYVYGVSLVSLEVVLWGVISLLRTMVSRQATGGREQLAQALALVFVGVPVFWLHWYFAQREAQEEPEARFSLVRAVFLYLLLAGLLIPLVQNLLALAGRSLAAAFGLPAWKAFLGGSQTLSDNLIAITLNGILAVYFLRVLREDWAFFRPPGLLPVVRRIYRYVWVLYSLLLVVLGVQRLLRYLLSRPWPKLAASLGVALFSNGLALLLVGLPVWYFSWRRVQEALTEADERRSLVRAGVLFFLSVIGLFAALSASGVVLNLLLRRLLGGLASLEKVAGEVNDALSVGLPMGLVWAYHHHWFRRALEDLQEQPWREGLGRVYVALLSLMGLTVSFVGVSLLLSFLVDATVGGVMWGDGLRSRLAGALSLLGVGLPVWYFSWQEFQAQARRADAGGERARRSLVRRVYLYAVLFVGVLGGMSVAVRLVFLVLNALLGEGFAGFGRDFLDGLQLLGLFAVLLGYHWTALREDTRLDEAALARRYAAFPVAILGEEAFLRPMAEIFRRKAPRLSPALLSPEEADLPSDLRVVILPRSLLLSAPERLRSRLNAFEGFRVVVADETPGWLWPEAAQAGVDVVLRLAEGERVTKGTRPVWVTVLWVLGILFGLQIVIGALMTLIPALFAG